MFRRDTCGKSGEAVMVAARLTIAAKVISLYSRPNVKYLGVRVKAANRNLYVDCSYIPRSNEVSLYVQRTVKPGSKCRF